MLYFQTTFNDIFKDIFGDFQNLLNRHPQALRRHSPLSGAHHGLLRGRPRRLWTVCARESGMLAVMNLVISGGESYDHILLSADTDNGLISYHDCTDFLLILHTKVSTSS